MPISEWFKITCDYCGYVFNPKENRILIVYVQKNGDHVCQSTRGHYCEECFNKVKGNGKGN